MNPPRQLSIDTCHIDGRVSLRLAGELDLASAPALEQSVAAEMKPGRSLTIDLSALDFIDSSGVRVLLWATTRAQESSVALSIVRGNSTVTRTFELLGLDGRLPFADG